MFETIGYRSIDILLTVPSYGPVQPFSLLKAYAVSKPSNLMQRCLDFVCDSRTFNAEVPLMGCGVLYV
jgi:hypothetical protein